MREPTKYARKLARQLSDVQRHAVLRGRISDERGVTIRILADRLGIFRRKAGAGTDGYHFVLTDNGRAVRQVLQEAADMLARRARAHNLAKQLRVRDGEPKPPVTILYDAADLLIVMASEDARHV